MYHLYETKPQIIDIIKTNTPIESKKLKLDFRFLKVDLEAANVVPETGDIIMYNELYYEADNINENQYFLGKDPAYSYSNGLNQFGASFSIIVNTHMTSPERLGIQKERL